MAFKEEEANRFLEDNYVGARKDKQDVKDKVREQNSERRYELFEKLLSEPWGREILYEIIIDADVLKINPFTGSSQTYYNEGLQAIAKLNMNYVRRFHFKEWMLMEQEAHNRRTKEIE